MELVKPFRRAGVPLVALECADPAEVIRLIKNEIENNGRTPALLAWDCVRGLCAANESGEPVAADLNGGQPAEIATGNPVECLRVLPRLPEGAVVVMLGMAQIMAEPSQGLPARQALWNLRDVLKSTGACVVLTLPLGTKLPAELSNDVATATVPLPGEPSLIRTVLALHQDAGLPEPDQDARAKAADALAGLSGFAAEQAVALSLSKAGMDVPKLWERKRRTIEQTPGLSVWRGSETFSDLGGCENAKRFFGSLIRGRRSPRCVVFIDEIEKAMAGAAGDTSGTSQGMLGALLTFMQDRAATGAIFIGPPGAAKSALAKAVGAEAGIPTIAFDLAGMKGSLVGESEGRIRAALQVVEAVGQGRALFIATCNSIGALPPELRRRFTLGTFFFDLPSGEERRAIWSIWQSKYKIEDQPLPDDEGWTGAEIRQACDIADRLGLPLVEAGRYVVPVARSAAEQIENLRKQASGRYLSAGAPGLYKYEIRPAAGAPAARKVEL